MHLIPTCSVSQTGHFRLKHAEMAGVTLPFSCPVGSSPSDSPQRSAQSHSP